MWLLHPLLLLPVLLQLRKAVLLLPMLCGGPPCSRARPRLGRCGRLCVCGRLHSQSVC